MRIAIEGAGDVLRRALGELVEAAGHDVVTGRVADLRIRVGPAGGDAGAVPTLWLSPPADRTADSERAVALERVLASGGDAVWDELDPAVLLDVLGKRPASVRGSPRAVEAPSPLATAPEPWLGVDVSRRRVLWANAA